MCVAVVENVQRKSVSVCSSAALQMAGEVSRARVGMGYIIACKRRNWNNVREWQCVGRAQY